MKKIFKIKEWLTLPDAAKHLSTIFDEDIAVTDVLQLAIERKLSLSVYFLDDVSLRRIEQIPISFSLNTVEPPPEFEIESFGLVGSINNRNFTGHFLRRTEEIISTSGLLNLVLNPSQFDMKKCYFKLVNSDLVPASGDESYFVKLPREFNNDIWEIVTGGNDCPRDFHPIYKLPENTFLVIRTAVLREFEQLIADSEDKSTIVVDEGKVKTESTRKTENLLRALTAIAMVEYGYHPESTQSNAPQDIADAMSKLGISFDPKTIRNWLRDGAALLPSKRDKN